jgi:3'5'-cyclic nucleotide phosphodiesterase
LESSLSRHSFSEKESRLIDWNVAVLMNFLEKVVGHRIINLNRNSITHGMSVSENGSTNEFLPNEVSSGLIIDEVAEVISLPRFNSSHTMIPSSSRILPSEIRGQMKEFVTAIASMYRQVPFHNFEHASHVTMSANKLMKRIITPEDTSKRPHEVSYALHMSTFGISSDPLTQFAVVFAALIHDVDHTGLSNEQLVKEDATIARIFKNKSVAEQNSVVLAWDLLMESRFSELQECIFADDSDRIRFRQLVVNAVMATDVLDKDMVALRKKRWEKAFDPSLSGEAFILDIDIHRKATIVIEHIIQASDVAHTMQHWHVFIKWNTKLYHELHRAYVNGHSYQDPSINWYQGQLSFFDDYVIPLAMKLRECGVFGVSGDEYLNYAILNRNEWEQKGKEETQKMIRFTRSVSSGRWKPELPESFPIELGDHSMELVN